MSVVRTTPVWVAVTAAIAVLGCSGGTGVAPPTSTGTLAPTRASQTIAPTAVASPSAAVSIPAAIGTPTPRPSCPVPPEIGEPARGDLVPISAWPCEALYFSAVDARGSSELKIDILYMASKVAPVFAPTIIQVSPGQQVTVTVVKSDGGNDPHDFTIDALGLKERVDPRTSPVIALTMPESGALDFYCTVHVSYRQGGTFVVTP